MDPQSVLSVCVALGAGLLVGAERERRKGRGPTRKPAGIRTFAVAALSGVTATLLGGPLVMAVVTLLVGAFALVSYRRSRSDDPGMTTEISLVLTCLIGGLCATEPALGAALGAGLAGLLAARDRVHHFVASVLSERELHDAILFAAAALIALPLAPDRFVGPFDGLNPRVLVNVVVLVMSVSAAGYIALRAAGPRVGLPIAALASGFISGIATIHSMGERSRREPGLMAGLVSGAVLTSIATIVQLAAVLALVAPPLLAAMTKPVLYAGITATLYAAWLTRAAWRADPGRMQPKAGRAFDLGAALGLAALVGAVQAISAALNAWLGQEGVLIAAAAAGLADAHSTTASVATLVSAARLTPENAVWPVLAGLTANTLVKIVVACVAGGKPFAARVVPGLVAMVAAAWLGAY